jgi:hypothetical protein
MDLYEWIWIGIVLSFYGVPFAIGLFVANPRTAILLAVASFCGLYATIWSALGPLFVPLVGALITRYELSGILILSFLAGALQAALVAAAGLALRQLLFWLRMRLSSMSTSHRAV